MSVQPNHHWCYGCKRNWHGCECDDILLGNKLCPTCEAEQAEPKPKPSVDSDPDDRKNKR